MPATSVFFRGCKRPRKSLKLGEGSAVVNSSSKPMPERMCEVHVCRGGFPPPRPLTPPPRWDFSRILAVCQLCSFSSSGVHWFKLIDSFTRTSARGESILVSLACAASSVYNNIVNQRKGGWRFFLPVWQERPWSFNWPLERQSEKLVEWV